MVSLFVLRVSYDELCSAIHMLQYDGAYMVWQTEKEYRIYTIRFTKPRWQHYGARPRVRKRTTTQKNWEAKAEQAIGFRGGFRFGQWFRLG